MQTSVVKSATRVLEVLEYFDEIRRPASVTEVSRALGFPQSSTSGLLRSLTQRGWCECDPITRRYVPTVRVMLLGSWLDAPVLEDGAVIRMLTELNRRTGENILLSMQCDLHVRHIYSIPAHKAGRPHIRSGTTRPLGRSGAGTLFLAMRADRQIAGLVRRLNAEEPKAAFRIKLVDLMDDVALTRQRGYSIALDRVAPGFGGMNVLLPRLHGSPPVAVAISSLSDVVLAYHAEWHQIVADATRRHLKATLPLVCG
jgi:DNA-binding IclR family transcriptional regulator